jgi:hypothetical protein
LAMWVPPVEVGFSEADVTGFGLSQEGACQVEVLMRRVAGNSVDILVVNSEHIVGQCTKWWAPVFMWKESRRVIREIRWVKEIRVLMVQQKYFDYLLGKCEVNGAHINVWVWCGW